MDGLAGVGLRGRLCGCIPGRILSLGNGLFVNLGRRPPARAPHRGKAPPRGAVAHERAAAKLFAEQVRKEPDRLGLGSLVHAGPPPSVVGGLHDERRGPGRVVLVGVNPPQAVWTFLEVEGECGKGLRDAQPDEAVGTKVGLGLEGPCEALPEGAAGAVRGYDQVRVPEGRAGGKSGFPDLRLEVELDAQIAAASVEDAQQRPAGQPRKAVAGGFQSAAPIVHVDVVPVVKGLRHRPVRLGVGGPDLFQRRVGKDHAEAEGVVGAVAFEYADRARRVGLLE